MAAAAGGITRVGVAGRGCYDDQARGAGGVSAPGTATTVGGGRP